MGKYFLDTRVKRYIKPKYTIETFFEEMNRRRADYVVLRWFENLPNIEPGEDIDLLLDGRDLEKVRDLFWPFEKGTRVDLYTDDGICHYNGVPYYPLRVARQILEAKVVGNCAIFTPDPESYFLSLAYHAVYHKNEKSGIPLKGQLFLGQKAGKPDHPYGEILGKLARKIGLEVEISLERLDSLLREKGWAPSGEILKGLCMAFPESRWLDVLSMASVHSQGAERHSVEMASEALLRLYRENLLEEARLGPDHPGLTEVLDRLSVEYERLGRQEESERVSRRVLRIWEEAFVPEYGWRHVLSDLFGGELTKVRPSPKFRDEDVLELTPELLLGTGDNRSCYAHPKEPSQCVKVDKPWNEGFHNTRRKRVKKALMPWLADFSSNREEARFYRTKALHLGEGFYRHAPRCYGIVTTNLGPGLVFERIRNADGTYAESLETYVRKHPDQLDLLVALVDRFLAFLDGSGLSLFVWDYRNLYVRCSGEKHPESLVAVDWKSEGRPNNDLPLTSIFTRLASWKMGRDAGALKGEIRLAVSRKTEPDPKENLLFDDEKT